jgi:hypothetical protein
MEAGRMIPVGDLDRMVETASELLDAAQDLDAGIGSELDRERIRRRLTPLDEGQPFQLDLGEVTLYANQSENVGKKRRRGEPDLGPGLLRNDAALVRAARWAVKEIIRAATFGHVRVEVDDSVRAVGTDAYGDALLRIADRLAQAPPLRRRRQCVRCGKDITHQRSTRRYCGNACKQAMMRARQRTAREESAR